jgi:uncharacterized paraquat-inducible protein A
LSETEDIFFKEKKKIKELERKLGLVKFRYRIYLGLFAFLLWIWVIILQEVGLNAYTRLIQWGSLFGLTLGSVVGIGLLVMLIKFIIFLVVPEPGAPMVSKEEREEDDYAARKLTACSDCMIVYDSRRLNCPECGNETMRKAKKKEETLLEEEE